MSVGILRLVRERTIPIADFLADEGFSGAAATVAREALEAAGITRPGKTGFSSAKLRRAREALDTLARVCERPECRDLLADGPRRLVEVPRSSCEVCGGSNSAGAVRRARADLWEGWPRVLHPRPRLTGPVHPARCPHG